MDNSGTDRSLELDSTPIRRRLWRATWWRLGQGISIHCVWTAAAFCREPVIMAMDNWATGGQPTPICPCQWLRTLWAWRRNIGIHCSQKEMGDYGRRETTATDNWET